MTGAIHARVEAGGDRAVGIGPGRRPVSGDDPTDR